MAVKLTKEQLEKIKTYKYSTSDWTPMDLIFNPWWEFVVNCLPKTIAPNLITLCGIIVPIMGFIYQGTYGFDTDVVLPASVLILNAFGMFWYQTLDAIDGKQARRTDNCSCLGQLLDHNLDQFSHSFFCVQGLAMLRAKGDYWLFFMIAMGQLLPHFTIEYRKHFTGFHSTVTEMAGGLQIGATECLMIMIVCQLMHLPFETTTYHMQNKVDFKGLVGWEPPFDLQYNYIIAFSTVVLSLQYNFGNLWIGLSESKDKSYAIQCMFPFFQFFGVMFLASKYSQFWQNYNALFLFGFGNLMTHITGTMNLMSSAKARFNPIFLDPFVFCGLLYLDCNRMLDSQILAAAYVLLVVNRSTQYILFLKSIVEQICDYCDMPFISVKQGWTSPKSKKTK